MIPPLHIVPDSAAPTERNWNGGLRIDTGGTITACHDDGEFVDAGILLTLRTDGTIYREPDVNPSLGFQLDGEGRIMLSPSDPLMQPRAGRLRCEFRNAKSGEWYWHCQEWIVARGDHVVPRIVALGATSEPAYPPGCEPVDAPAATVDGMTAEMLDECLARAHWSTFGVGVRPDDSNIAALTAPAYARWLERQKGASK